MARKTRTPLRRKIRQTSMSLSIARLRVAHKRLTGVSIDTGTKMMEQANEMLRTYGEAKILEALADYNLQDYIDGKLEV